MSTCHKGEYKRIVTISRIDYSRVFIHQSNHSHGIHQMYICARLSLLLASAISCCTCPSTLRGMEGRDSTPNSVPVNRPGCISDR